MCQSAYRNRSERHILFIIKNKRKNFIPSFCVVQWALLTRLMRQRTSLSLLQSFSAVKFFSELMHIAFFLLVNLQDLLLRQNFAELTVILFTDIQHLTALCKSVFAAFSQLQHLSEPASVLCRPCYPQPLFRFSTGSSSDGSHAVL